MNNYSFGKCSICYENKVLKDGICIECAKKEPLLPDFFRKIIENNNEPDR